MSSFNTLKVTNIFRGRLKMIQTFAEVYHPEITKSKQKLEEFIRETAERAGKTEVARKIKVLKGYYTLEMALPSSSEISKIKSDLKLAQEFWNKGVIKQLTVRQAWLLILVGLEISLWFFMGETLGKFHIVGYAV